MPKNGYIKLSWQGIHEEYIIEYSLDGVNWMPLARTKEKSYLHTNLDPNQIYYYRVWGVIRGQKSSVPAQISGYARDTVPPSPPTGLTVNSSQGGLVVTLRPNPEPDWDGFEIHLSQEPNFIPSPTTLKALGKLTYFVISDVAPRVTYYIKAIAYDTSGNKSEPSPEVRATYLPILKRFDFFNGEFQTTSNTYVEIPSSRFIFEAEDFGGNIVNWSATFRCDRYETEAYLQLWDVENKTEVAILAYPSLLPPIREPIPPTPWITRETQVELRDRGLYIVRARTNGGIFYVRLSTIKYR